MGSETTIIMPADFGFDMVDIGEAAHELRGVFPDLSRSDFYYLDNGNVGVEVTYATEGYANDDFNVLIEYHGGYPDAPPNAWIQHPDIDSSCPHGYGEDDYGNYRACYIYPDQWKPRYTSYDAAIMIKTWVYAYCNWETTGNWDWHEAH